MRSWPGSSRPTGTIPRTVIAPTCTTSWTVSVAGSYDVTDNGQLFARAENLFNEDYEEIFGKNTPGLGVFGGVKISFGE